MDDATTSLFREVNYLPPPLHRGDHACVFHRANRTAAEIIAAASGDRWCTSSDAAHVLKVSTERIRQLAVSGRLPSIRTLSGIRLYRLSDVRALAEERRHRGHHG